MKTENCIHCGADKGLHHYQTMQCPVGGVETPIGRKQEWMSYTYEQRDPLREAAPELLSALEELVTETTGITPEDAYSVAKSAKRSTALAHARAAIAKAKGD